MKQIVMLQGMGLNERGWAKLISKYGRVVLIQEGYVDHGEVWENGECVEFGPMKSVIKTRFYDEVTFSGFTMLRTLKQCWKFTRGQKLDLMIAASYAMAMVALFFRATGKTRKVVCTVVDHLPPKGSLAVRTHRFVTRFLTRFVAKRADEVWAIAPRIPEANHKQFVQPFPIDDNKIPFSPRDEIGYIGFPTHDHALDILFEVAKKNNFKVNVIGDSPYLQSIKHLAPPSVTFHGVMSDKAKITAILSRCFCGYAVYRTTGPSSSSYYGFPSKSLSHFANNTPLLTTSTSYFTQKVEELGVGRVVDPVPEKIEEALLDLKAQFPKYYEAVGRFRETWNADVEKFHHDRLTDLLKD